MLSLFCPWQPLSHFHWIFSPFFFEETEWGSICVGVQLHSRVKPPQCSGTASDSSQQIFCMTFYESSSQNHPTTLSTFLIPWDMRMHPWILYHIRVGWEVYVNSWVFIVSSSYCDADDSQAPFAITKSCIRFFVTDELVIVHQLHQNSAVISNLFIILF